MDPFELLRQSARQGVPLKRIQLDGGLCDGRIVPASEPPKKNAVVPKKKKGTAYARNCQESLGFEDDYEVDRARPSLEKGTMNALEDLTSYCTSEAPVSTIAQDECLEVYKSYSFQRNRTTKLLIDDYKDVILSQIAANSVVIIKGPTGCGKTTQIPQYILDDARESNIFCNIICTQPRRIAATSVAKRVCAERDWTVGQIVGYQISLEKKTSSDTRITFCTAGVLLQRLVTQRSLSEFSHIIIDEVHERDSETDFLLIVIRKLMKLSGSRIKLILMSATINTDKFCDYFTRKSGERTLQPPVIELPDTHKYQVDIYYLEDLQHTLAQSSCNVSFDEPKIDTSLYYLTSLIINVFNKIEKRDKGPYFCGAVLIFLPGIHEIEELYKILQISERDHKFETKLMLCPLHSTMSFEDQMKVFQNPPTGQRKVILATNIAESSITVPDVKYVIDFCLTKHIVQNRDTFYSGLQMAWVTKSQAIQRAGRVGRTMPGRVYRLIWKEMYEEEMSDDPKPEILQCPLDQLVLKSKVLNMGSPQSILGLAIDPPDLSNIHRTVLNLKEMGALTLKIGDEYIEDDGELTATGRIMAGLPLDTQLSKLILLGHMMSMLRECVIMACCMASRSIFINPVGSPNPLDSYNAKLTWSHGSSSDLLAYLNVYEVWREAKNRGQFERSGGQKEEEYCRKKFLQLRSLREVERLETEVLGRLNKLGIVDDKLPAVAKKTAYHPFFLKLAIAGAFYPNYFENVPIEEQEAIKVLGCRDPKRTVYFSKFPQDQPGPLYRDSIKELVADCGSNIKVQFDGSSKVYIEFGSNSGRGDQSDDYSDSLVSEKVMPAVYRAIKLRQLNIPMKIPILQPSEARKRAKKIFGDQLEQSISCWQKPCQVDVKESCLPKLGTSVMRIHITWVYNPHKFYAQRFNGRNSKANWQHHEINKDEDGILVDLQANEFKKGLKCLAPFQSEDGQKPDLFRAEVLHVDPNSVKVLFIDYGNVEYIEKFCLKGYGKKLIDKGIPDDPPYCFQCRLSEIQPIAYASDKGWNKDATRRLNFYLNRAVDAEIFSVLNDTVAIRLYDSNVKATNMCFENSFNYKLVTEKLAELMEESYLSIENHELRQQIRENPGMHQPSTSVDEDRQRHLDTLDFCSPTREDTRLTHTLLGPRSPLEMGFSPLMRKCCGKSVSIDYNSINSVALDNNPMNMCKKVVIAATVTQSVQGERLTLRNTTLMPPVRGLLGIICLLFAPYAELRADVERTCITGALCGIGCDENGMSYDQENDIEVAFDTKFVIEDIEKINCIRFWINRILGGIDGEECLNRESSAQAQQKIVEYLLTLFSGQRENLLPTPYANAYEWHQIPEEHLLVSSANCEQFIYPLISGIELQETPLKKKIDDMDKHLAAIKMIVDGHEMKNPMTCKLCEIYLETSRALKMHLTSTCHKSRLREHQELKKKMLRQSND